MTTQTSRASAPIEPEARQEGTSTKSVPWEGTRPLLVLVPSRAAALDLPRRLARTNGAIAGIFALTLSDLARLLAEPVLLGRGLAPEPPGQTFLLTLKLLDEGVGDALRLDAGAPRASAARALSRTLRDLREAEIAPTELRRLAKRRAGEDRRRLVALSEALEGFEEGLGAVQDEVARLRAAVRLAPASALLQDAEILVLGDPASRPLERELLVRLTSLGRACALGAAGLDSPGLAAVEYEQTALGLLAPPPQSRGLARLVDGLFAKSSGIDVSDESVELLTAPGEAAEVRAIARRILRRAAEGTAFEDMAVLLPPNGPYAALVSDLFTRLEVPFRLWSPPPLRSGRVCRSLELLLRCRGLGRRAVLEFLSFAPVPFGDLLGADASAPVLRWERLSREAGVVAGLAQWITGLRALVEAEQADQPAESAQQTDGLALQHTRTLIGDAENLLRLVELISATLDGLSGHARWAEWGEQVCQVLDQWIGPELDRASVVEVVRGLAAGASQAPPVPWGRFEEMLFARFDAASLPSVTPAGGAVQVGEIGSLAGLHFRDVFVAGLVEGGLPGVVRPDPFLLDDERMQLDEMSDGREPALARPGPAQLALFPAPSRRRPRLETTRDRLAQTRRVFRQALSQATERLVLSYPRADPRTGRERLPSLFFAAAASALAGRPLSAAELACRVVEDDLRDLPPQFSLDRSERDRARMARGGVEAVIAISAGCAGFRRSRLALRSRLSRRLTEFDGLVSPLPEELRDRLDPALSRRALSATRLSAYARCGFQYFLSTVLGLQAREEPEARLGLDPAQKGLVFHAVAERFLRELREAGVASPTASPKELRRIEALVDEELDRALERRPLRHGALVERERRRLGALLSEWLAREVRRADGSRPLHFELPFGSSGDDPAHAPHAVALDLGGGRAVPLAGRIDRIDCAPDGGFILRDYKTGRAPRDPADPMLRAALLVQLPLYVHAVRQVFPGVRIAAAVCDYVADRGQIRKLEDVDRAADRFLTWVEDAASAMRDGLFVQDPKACGQCLFTIACGSEGALAARRDRKAQDPRLRRASRLGEPS